MSLGKNRDEPITKDLNKCIKNGDRSISDGVKYDDPEMIIQGSIKRESCKDLKRFWKKITNR